MRGVHRSQFVASDIMSNVEFVLPVHKDDLCSGSHGQYVVSDIIPPKDINSIIVSLHRVLQDEGLDFIFKNFDIFYSILRHFAKLENEIRIDSFQVLIMAASKLSEQLSFLLDNEGEQVDYESRMRYRNLLKMTAYLLCQLAEAFETEAAKPSTEVVVAGGKGKKRPKKKDDCSWENERENFIAVLHQLYQKPIHKLWDPPIIEEEFLSLATCCCFKMMEDVTVSRNKALREAIFNFLGMCLKKHSNSLGYSVKIIQLLQDYEHLVSPLAIAVSLFVTEYGAKNLISEVVREVGYIEVKDLSRDASGMRSISQFIVELAGICPNQVVSSLNILMPYLDEEAYTMRNCVLSVFGEVVIKVLSSDDLSEKSKDLRDQILDKLEEHIHDVTAFVRCKSLQVWKQLCSEQAIPLPRQHQLLELVTGRLHDKSSSVRKNAIQFLTVFLQKNPYSAVISVEEIKKNAEKERKTLEKMLADAEENNIQCDKGNPENTPTDDNDVRRQIDFEREEKELENMQEKENSKSPAPSKEHEEVVSALSKQQVLVKYLEDTVKFAEQITKALSLICEFMQSKVTTDVLEAIDFFVAAFEFGVRGAVVGVKQMFNLVWTKENAIKDAVVNAYRHLYFKTEGTNPRTEAMKVAQNLVGFLKNATISEVACIEELVKEFVKSGDINAHVIKVLWEKFTKKLPDTTDEESHSCLVLLSMAAGYQPEIVSSNIDNLVSIGLGERAKSDFLLAKETCTALLEIKTAKPSMESKDPPFRLKETENIFVRLAELMVEGITNEKDFNWIPFAEQAITVIYSLADFPEKICGGIIKKLAQEVIASCEKHEVADASQSSGDSSIKCSSLLLCRFISVCGHVALAQVTHLEVNVFAELKRRQNLKEGKRNLRIRPSLNKSLLTPISSKANEAEEDTGLIGAVADDAEGEFIRKICETEILDEKNLLGVLCPLILTVCRDPSKYALHDLCAASSLALAKFMMVSSEFCENNMQLLITILERSSEPVTRANIVIALGDLATRFPNAVEPWTPRIYGRLKDPSVHVRKYTVSVLTHLILHDMVKVKGQISDMALCIVDDDENIVGLTKFFFGELARKGNAVYNVLPDIISRLSDPENGTSEENFQIIMKFLLQFIEKDRQVESLVEKLCHRFRAARTDTQYHEIAFCMSQLTYNDKCLNKLHENVACFGDKLKDPVVNGYFMNIVNASKKAGTKAETEIEALMKILEI